jgi:hypothetical protein
MTKQLRAQTNALPEGSRTQAEGSRIHRNWLSTAMAVAGILMFWLPGTASAQNLEWRKIVGVIQADNAVGTGTGKVTSGGQPWITTGGSAAVDLTRGDLAFVVQGLVLAGGNSIGTPGAVNQVKGTLVCDTTGSLTGNTTLVDTPLVTLSATGAARFAGNIGAIPAACTGSPNIAFLIRTASGGWIAAGEVRESQ